MRIAKALPGDRLGLALRERPRWGIVIVLLCGFVFAGYLYMIRVQVQEIHAVLPHPYICAFGRNVSVDKYNRFHHGVIPHMLPILLLVVISFGICVASFCAPPLPAMRKMAVEGLLIGGLLYVSTFILSANFNYRMIFLLFTVPALIELVPVRGLYGRLTMGLLIALAIGWALADNVRAAPFFIKEVANWMILAGIAFLVLQSLLLPLVGYLGSAGLLMNRELERE